VKRLCGKAARPIRSDLAEKLGPWAQELTVGAVCVYPSRVRAAVAESVKHGNKYGVAAGSYINNWSVFFLFQNNSSSNLFYSNLSITVATGFPSGQYALPTRLEEIKFAVSEGATEIDVVINRTLALTKEWEGKLKIMNIICYLCEVLFKLH